ncbi:MAG: glutamine synthetase III [Candidatus Eiseniibacteriota bacterium]
MHPSRLWAIQEATRREVRIVPHLSDPESARISHRFGANTFNVEAMREKLPKPVYQALIDTIQHGRRLDASIADSVAHAVKEWALEHGTTHFCHWFMPMTGLTAEKHDSFLTFTRDGLPIERFSGSQLIQSEPDASSFPSGGMRTTFEARGYTAWDPSSPIFIMEAPNGRTLCVPSVFISYYGEALDKRTPLLRSMQALERAALDIIALFGNSNPRRVIPTVGPEQEYFLIDRAFFALRPDLVAAGRTLLGARPPRGQELEDHYFGAIQGRIQACMQEAEHELYKLGVPVKTRHNEVAPSQYESAPIFEPANVAADHNQLVMEVLDQVARRHRLALLLHEKPFAGVNGSGKHVNWSMMTDTGANLLDPGDSPHRNLRFLVFLMGTVRAVHQRAALLRGAIARAGNDHRLGANEAPPAIISVYLGDQLSEIIESIEAGTVSELATEERILRLGLSSLPDVNQDYTDRNRTSPFAFTGNKFEFRAVGASANIASPVTVLNAAVAESLEHLHQRIKTQLEGGKSIEEASLDVIREVIAETRDVRFEGNNYDPAWIEEATRRGLPHLRSTPEALEQFTLAESIELFKRTGVMTEGELRARYNVWIERYLNDLGIEVEALLDLVRTSVLPAATKHQRNLAEAAHATAQALGDGAPSHEVEELERALAAIARTRASTHRLQALWADINRNGDPPARARRVAAEVMPAMAELREAADALEEMVDDDLWPLPSYPEMLFLT